MTWERLLLWFVNGGFIPGMGNALVSFSDIVLRMVYLDRGVTINNFASDNDFKSHDIDNTIGGLENVPGARWIRQKAKFLRAETDDAAHLQLLNYEYRLNESGADLSHAQYATVTIFIFEKKKKTLFQRSYFGAITKDGIPNGWFGWWVAMRYTVLTRDS